MMKIFTSMVSALVLTSCSVFGNSGVENAPYKVLQKDGRIEVRQYDKMVLVSAPMGEGMSDNRGAFGLLFDYISGENVSERKIPMTAPVFMEGGVDKSAEGEKIPMTAPVFMNEDQAGQWRMSFVMPADMRLEDTPKPKNPSVDIEGVKDWTVGAIGFSGFLNEKSSLKHYTILNTWLAKNGYDVTGQYISAGYNPPWTLPMARRNEVLVPVQKK